MHPQFLRAIEFARNSGYECTLATNGRRFSQEKFTKKVASLGLSQIRSTLLGHTPDIHNLLSVGGIRSYDQTIKGFKNILCHNIPLQVNIVIMEPNYRFLPEMTDLLITIGVQDIKYSSIIGVEKYPHLAKKSPFFFPLNLSHEF